MTYFYSYPQVKNIIENYKFFQQRHNLFELSTPLVDYIQDIRKSYPQAVFCITAPDLHRKKIKGYSFSHDFQSILLKNNIQAFIPIIKFVTTKERNKMNKKERENIDLTKYKTTNLVNIKNPEKIYIIDDIVTTGATLYEHFLILQHSYPQAKIECLCIAGE